MDIKVMYHKECPNCECNHLTYDKLIFEVHSKKGHILGYSFCEIQKCVKCKELYISDTTIRENNFLKTNVNIICGYQNKQKICVWNGKQCDGHSSRCTYSQQIDDAINYSKNKENRVLWKNYPTKSSIRGDQGTISFTNGETPIREKIVWDWGGRHFKEVQEHLKRIAKNKTDGPSSEPLKLTGKCIYCGSPVYLESNYCWEHYKYHNYESK